MKRRDFLKSASGVTLGSIAAATVPYKPAAAQGRDETLLFVREVGHNNLDLHPPGPNRPAYGHSWNTYDRVLSYGSTTVDGQPSYDFANVTPELAKSFEEDGMDVIMRLHEDATFHDGSPVTAEDVRYSFERALAVGGFPTFQMKAGSIEDPSQFTVMDDHTLKFTRLRGDPLTIPNMAVPIPQIFNSKLVKANSTSNDPWGLEWTKTNMAGGGAYRMARWAPGEQTLYERFNDWKSGPLPPMERVILREVASASQRRALLEAGDIDMSFDLPPKDFAELAEDPRFTVVGVLIENSYFYLSMDTRKAPYNDVKVRQALAWAMPYDAIYENAFFKRGKPLYGAASQTVASTEWPQPSYYNTDLQKAKELLTAAGYPDGFEATLSIDIGTGTVSEPTAVLIQESFAEIGVRVTIDKKPSSAFRGAMVERSMDMHINNFGGWLNYPHYFFRWTHHSSLPLFNTSSYQNPKIDELVDKASYGPPADVYDSAVKELFQISFDEVPNIPFIQSFLDVAMLPNVKGYQYWFHRQLDFRRISKA